MTLIDNPAWTLTDRLRKARMLADLEQAQIAELLGVARNTVSNWETGRSEPPASAFVRWARITGVSLDWLAGGLNDETPADAGVSVGRARRDSNPQPSDPESLDDELAFWLIVEPATVLR